MTRALVLIDLQNDYFPGGRMELVGADAAVQAAARLLGHFRAHGLPVVHIQHVAQEPDFPFFQPGTAGVEIHAAVAPQPGEPVIVKHHANGFRETTLLDTLRAAGITELQVVGMMTHMCVDTTVRAASDLGFACTLASDACATTHLALGADKVDARSVQLAYLAGLDGAFASVKPVDTILAERG